LRSLLILHTAKPVQVHKIHCYIKHLTVFQLSEEKKICISINNKHNVVN